MGDNLTRMFRIRKTCLEMLNDRGYLVAQVRVFCAVPRASWVQVRCNGDLLLLFRRRVQDELNMTKDTFKDKFSGRAAEGRPHHPGAKAGRPHGAGAPLQRASRHPAPS